MTVAQEAFPTAPPGARASSLSLRLAVVLGAMVAGVVCTAAYNLSHGEPNVGLDVVWRALIGTPESEMGLNAFIIRELRLPRLVLALVCGAALGLAGVLLQDSLRNPLADPGLLGISQGASFAVAVSFFFPELIPVQWSRPVLCFIAGGAAGLVVISTARSLRDPVRLLLAGTVLSILVGTLTSTIIQLIPPEARDGGSGLAGYLRFSAGSVSAGEWWHLQMVAPWLVVAIPAAFFSSRALNLLQLGDDMAAGIGLNPQRTRLGILVVAMALVAPVVAAIGPIAFVALLAPHVARGLLQTSDARPVLVASAVAGMLVLLIADTVGRLLLFPTEVPAGIWTILVIGPVAILAAGRIAGRTAQ